MYEKSRGVNIFIYIVYWVSSLCNIMSKLWVKNCIKNFVPIGPFVQVIQFPENKVA